MKTINLIFFILFLATLTAQAEELTVVDVSRNIPLSDDEPIYRDYIIGVGDVGLLKKNLVVLVKRNLNMKSIDQKEIGFVDTAVAQVKIIHVDKKIAVARDYKLIPRDNEVMLENLGVMTGDRIDLAGAFADNKPAKREPSAALVEKPAAKDITTPVPQIPLQPEI